MSPRNAKYSAGARPSDGEGGGGGGLGGHPDSYVSGGGCLKQVFFSALLALVWSKNKGGGVGPQTWVITSFEAG